MRLTTSLSPCLLAAGLTLAACSHKPELAPEQPCGTEATVRLCPGKTAICLTEHTTLELADGTRLRPVGPVWAAYQPHQANGQVIIVGYWLGGLVPGQEPGSTWATLTCLDEGRRCGTLAPGGE